MTTWTSPTDGFSGDDDLSAEDVNEYAGDLNHLHQGGHLSLLEQLTHVGGSTWQCANDYLSGKFFLVAWQNILIPGSWFAEQSGSQIRFNQTMLDAVNGGNNTDSGDVVIASYVITE